MAASVAASAAVTAAVASNNAALAVALNGPHEPVSLWVFVAATVAAILIAMAPLAIMWKRI